MCNNEQSRNNLLNQIMALNFAINDLTLYLDTHPYDTGAMNTHDEYVNQVRTLATEYQNKFGPLTINFNSNDNYWQWSESPWPWERS